MASDLDLDAYLARIGERAPLAPGLDALATLHRAHCAAIPFENLDILLARPIADLYAFTLEPHYPVDFEMANHFTSTWPRSPFVLNLTAQRSWPERRAILRNRDLVVREDGVSTATFIRDPDHLLAVLDGVFGLAFPPGTRFRQPEL